MIPIPIISSIPADQVILVLSAHCDDAAIGCSGLLKRLTNERPDLEIKEIVFCGDNPDRNDEEKAAAPAFGVHDIRIRPYPDTLLPNHWHEIKGDLTHIGKELDKGRIGMILCPRLEDRHQDHRVIAENVWRIFRNHLVLEYEIHKYEGDLGHPNLYVALTEAQAQEKVDLLLEYYPSQHWHPWWNSETFFGLMRLRGVEINAKYAEAFVARKMLL